MSKYDETSADAINALYDFIASCSLKTQDVSVGDFFTMLQSYLRSFGKPITSFRTHFQKSTVHGRFFIKVQTRNVTTTRKFSNSNDHQNAYERKFTWAPTWKSWVIGPLVTGVFVACKLSSYYLGWPYSEPKREPESFRSLPSEESEPSLEAKRYERILKRLVEENPDLHSTFSSDLNKVKVRKKIH